MKKAFFILFAVVVLACVVSCSSYSSKATTGVQVDTSDLSEFFSRAASAEVQYNVPSKSKLSFTEKKAVSLTEVLDGSVFIPMNAGYYDDGIYFILYDASETRLVGNYLDPTTKKSTTEILVVQGEITPCTVYPDD